MKKKRITKNKKKNNQIKLYIFIHLRNIYK